MLRLRLFRVTTRSAVSGMAAIVAVTGLMGAPSAVAQTPPQSSSPASTPRMPDGKPDLNGMWNGTAGPMRGEIPSRLDSVGENGNLTRLAASRRCAPNQQGCRDNTNQSNDGEFTGRTNTSRPLYKPEYWDRVQFLDYDTNFSDPTHACYPAGVPRSGPPAKIVHMPHEVIFVYGSSHLRIIPLDGRGHDPEAFPSFYGDSVAKWDGDTLVVEAVSFNDTTWLANRGGYFHSFDMRVTERFRREGDIVHYNVTIEDPTVLVQPWELAPRQMRLNRDKQATIDEPRPCLGGAYHLELAETRIRH